MPITFSCSVPPFDRLTTDQRDRLRAAIDLVYFPKGALILTAGTPAEGLFVVARGRVEERHNNEPVARYGALDLFDPRTAFGDAPIHSFLAVEDTLCHLLPREIVTALAEENPPFRDAFAHDLAVRLKAMAVDRASRELAAMAAVPLAHALIHPPVTVAADATLAEVARAMKTHHASAVLVRIDGGTGIVTGTDLREATLIEGQPATAPVGPLAHTGLIALDDTDTLFDALVQMIRHSVRRVVVRHGEAILGIVDQLDVLSFLSNHSQIVALRIERARTPDDLAKASLDQVDLVRTLHSTGVKAHLIAEMVTELNRHLFRRLFEMLAPPDLLANACLIVMGSEGRGEQILKTDQDNGLILRDGYACPELDRVIADFTRYLENFGYPPCPGKVMVSNPMWTKPLADYRKTIRGWLARPDGDAMLNLAIFCDAAAVAGDAALMAEVRTYLLERMAETNAFYSHFARATLAFEGQPGLLGSVLSGRAARSHVDIKKSAIFPIVHGIRSLALQHHTPCNGTLERIWWLCDAQVLDRPFATELAEGFEMLQTLRLGAQLSQGTPGGTEGANVLRTELMSKVEREQLTACLDLARRFKQFVSHHFHLEMF